MGRPYSPPQGGGEGGSQQGKAGKALYLVLVGIVTVVIGIVSVAVPYWGYFSPTSNFGGRLSGPSSYEGGGYVGPFLDPCWYTLNGFSVSCNGNKNFNKEIVLVIAGICALVGVITSSAFTALVGLHCAMLVNNKKIMFSFRRNIFLALIAISLSVLACIGAVILGAIQLNSGNNGYKTTVGFCYIIQIVLIVLNTGLFVCCFLVYKKSKKTQFPRPNNPYEISAERYEPGPQPSSGISVTATSGHLYPPHQQQQPPLHLTAAALPQYPAPTNGHVFQQGPYINSGQNGAGNNGYAVNGLNGQQYFPTGQLAQPQARSVPLRDGVSMNVNLNPEGRVSFNQMRGAGPGSTDSLNSTESCSLSVGSTGSFSSNISNPLRSSLKKGKNKDNNSVVSGLSKKSVTIAIGAEQTAV